VTLITLFINLNDILALFGANDVVVKFAEDYMRIILSGFIFQMISFILNTGVRAEGRPLFSMAAMVLSAISNILLDYLFIVLLGWGVKGAALATISGQLAGLILLLSFYIRGKSNLHLKISDFFPDLKIARDIIILGFSTFISTIGVSISMVFLNRGLSQYGGTAAISSMGAINSLYTLFIMPIMGIQQGMQPILGYNYGAGLTKRVNQTLKLTLAVAIIFSTTVFLVLELFPSSFITMFIDSQSDTVAVAVRGLRIFVLLLPLLSINIIGIAYFQSTAKGRIALELSLLRQFVFLVPLVLIIPSFFGLTGVWAATPIADGLAIIITLIVLIRDRRKRNQMYEAAKIPLVREAVGDLI
jgi:putative MATE family efflux protein